MTRFSRFELRTTDVDAARRFYDALLELPSDISPLPEAALARGAQPHWLGHLGVDDVARTTDAFVARGAVRIGPRERDRAIVRDPGGAVVAFSSVKSAARGDVVWHLLNTSELAKTKSAYVELLGWALTDHVDYGAQGEFDQFAWSEGGPSVGSIGEITHRPGVHAHWLFHFRVADLERSMAAVRAAGGLVVGPFELPGGHRLAVCDDPQGAGFAIRQS